MTWPGHKGRVELSEERPNPIRQDRSNRDEISEWRPALPRQPHESRDMDLDGSQIQRTHGISDPTDNHTFLNRNKDYRIIYIAIRITSPKQFKIKSTSL